MRRLLFAALAVTLMAPAAARAADPILALEEVQPGMRCTGLSVVQGLTIVPFDVEVVDVVDRARGATTARIIVRVSGAPVDVTGLGPGFSGSPILCTGADGIARNIGAISETVGEYGGKTALATPIEAILAQPASPPAATRTRIIGARSLAGPLTIAGLRPSLARAFVRAARKAGHTLFASPGGTRAAFAPQPLVPGASVSVGLTSGDIAIGAIGTVAYADGPNVWIYGHQLDSAGRRSLFLQDAYIHTVVNNPIAVPEVSTYKLGSPGNDVGTITSDGPTAVVGALGAPPPSFPLRVTAKDLDTGRERSAVTQIADEGDVGLPTGSTSLSLTGSAAVAEAAAAILGGAPARQTGELCVKATLRELRTPLRVCWRYAVEGASQNALAGAAAADVASAVAVLESYKFATLHPTAIEVGLRVRRGLRQAYILSASGPSVVRRGSTIRVALRLRHTGSGVRSTRTLRLRIPATAPTGLRTLRLIGTPADSGGDPSQDGGDLSLIFEGDEGVGTDGPGPASLAELRSVFEGLERFDGVVARLGGEERHVLDDPRLRISGEARLRLRIR
jgi:hypothetical protein